MDEQIEKLAAAWYEQGLIIGLGIRDSLTGNVKEASLQDAIRTRFGLKTAADGGGNNYGGIGDATPTDPPPTPSNDSGEKQESSNVVKDQKGEQNLPEGELAQGHVGETSTGDPEKEAGMAQAAQKVKDVVVGGAKAVGSKAKDVNKATNVWVNRNPAKAKAVAAGAVGTAGVGGFVAGRAGRDKEAESNPFETAIL